MARVETRDVRQEKRKAYKVKTPATELSRTERAAYSETEPRAALSIIIHQNGLHFKDKREAGLVAEAVEIPRNC